MDKLLGAGDCVPTTCCSEQSAAERPLGETEAGLREYRAAAAQVDSCIHKFLYTQRAARMAAKLQREGKEVPKSFEGMAKLLGACPAAC